MIDLVLHNVSLLGKNEPYDIAIDNGVFVDIAPNIASASRQERDVAGALILPASIDCHVHFMVEFHRGCEPIKESPSGIFGARMLEDISC